jgi:hypothetical protein
MIINVCFFMLNSCYFQNLKKLGFFQKYSNIRFHENASIERIDIRCRRTEGQTYMTKLKSPFVILRKRLQILHGTFIALMYFMWISEQAMTIALYTTNRLVLYNRGGESLLRGTHLVLNPLTPKLNPSVQRCLTRFFTGDFAS